MIKFKRCCGRRLLWLIISERIRKNKNKKWEPTHSCCISKNVFGAKRIVSADYLYIILSWIIRERPRVAGRRSTGGGAVKIPGQVGVVLFEKRVLF